MEFRVSNSQMFFTYLIIVSNSFGLSHFLIKQLQQDFWQPILISIVVEVIFAWFLYKMGTYYSRQTIYQYSEKIVGKIAGKAITIMLSGLFIGIACLFTVSIAKFFSSIIMPETPMAVFVIGLLLVSSYAIYIGIEGIMRLSELIGIAFILSILAMTIFNYQWYDLGNLRPMFQHDLSEIVHALPLPVAWFSICIVMGVLMAYQNQPKDAFKVKVSGAIIGMFMLFLITLVGILVIGVEFGLKQNYPVFLLARLVIIGEFIERLEAVQVVTWTVSSFYALAIFQFAGVEGFQHLMPKRSRLFLDFFVAGIIAFIVLVLFPLGKDHFELINILLTDYFVWMEIGLTSTLFGIWFGKGKIRQWRKRMKL